MSQIRACRRINSRGTNEGIDAARSQTTSVKAAACELSTVVRPAIESFDRHR